jgi:hypothetical protein
MDTTIVATAMASHGRAPGAPALVPVRAGGVDGPGLTSAGMYSSMDWYHPIWLAMMAHRPNG